MRKFHACVIGGQNIYCEKLERASKRIPWLKLTIYPIGTMPDDQALRYCDMAFIVSSAVKHKACYRAFKYAQSTRYFNSRSAEDCLAELLAFLAPDDLAA